MNNSFNNNSHSTGSNGSQNTQSDHGTHEYRSFVESFEREVSKDAPDVSQIMALARVENSIDVEALRQSVVENSHLLTHEFAEKFHAIVLDDKFHHYRYRVGLLKDLPAIDKHKLARYLGAYSVQLIKFVVLDSMIFDVLMREGYESRNLTRATTRKNRQLTRSTLLWSTADPAPNRTADTDPNAPEVGKNPAAKIDLDEMATKRWDISDLTSYYELLPKIEAGGFAESMDTHLAVLFLLQDFILAGASDFHLHSGRRFCRIRYRYQGKMYTRFKKIPVAIGRRIAYNLVIMASKDAMKQSRNVIESVILLTINLEGEVKDVEFRIESMPSLHAPSVNLRGQTRPLTDINKIGLTFGQIEDLKKALTQDDGIIILTGATGSGKNNTLNCAFAILEEDDSRVILEFGSPIEIESDNRVQISIRESESEKMNEILYLRMFKAALRFDPDVIAFTEMRSEDEARIVFRAASTGHLVFTTMHSADIEQAFGRLFEMNIDRSIIAKGIKCIVAQTLVQRLCDNCKIEDPESTRFYGKFISRPDPNGCQYCDDGFDGRSAIAEVLYLTEEMQQMIVDGGRASDIVQYAERTGRLVRMKQIALEKLFSGLTSKSEVENMIDLETRIDSESIPMPQILREDYETFDDSSFPADLPIQEGELIESGN